MVDFRGPPPECPARIPAAETVAASGRGAFRFSGTASRHHRIQSREVGRVTKGEQILSDLKRLGVELTLEGDEIRYRAPRAKIPETRSLLTAHKAEVLRALRTEVARRVDAFRELLRECEKKKRAGIPVLVMPGMSGALPNGCISCGGLVASGHLRCELCREAALI